MNYTPGTWKAIFAAKQSSGLERYDVVVEDQQRKLVAICWDTGEVGEQMIHDARANANLIAAAPELYEACTEALRVMIGEMDDVPPNERCGRCVVARIEAIRKLREALRKASAPCSQARAEIVRSFVKRKEEGASSPSTRRGTPRRKSDDPR